MSERLQMQHGASRCVPQGVESDPPTLTSALLSAGSARDGQTVELTLTASEPLYDAPRVELVTEADRFAFLLRSSANGEYHYALEVRRELHSAGKHRVLATPLDASGNASIDQLIGPLSFDFDRPEVVGPLLRVTTEGTTRRGSALRPSGQRAASKCASGDACAHRAH